MENHNIDFSILSDAETALEKVFKNIDLTAKINQYKVLDAFWRNRVAESYLHGTSGYGYDDKGRDVLDSVFADIFNAEDALVRHNFVSGTHAIATALYGILRPGDRLFSISGSPYDTLYETIGLTGNAGNGSLKDFGIEYIECDLKNDDFDYEKIKDILSSNKIKAVYIQRSRGYTQRKTLSIEQIKNSVEMIRNISPETIIIVDNCYGEFVSTKEPTDVGVDIVVGSLIKNPGGGIAETGGYIAGKKNLIDLCAQRLTAVGIGKECGATLNTLKQMYQGLFFAPHVTAQALKTAVLASYLFEKEGYSVSPRFEEKREDIIQTITFNDKDKLIRFCETIQSTSPVDSYVRPEPWAMPGYQHEVIMAAGTFNSGASIELSADAPIKEPYTVYMQGGLTYESGSISILKTILKMRDL